MNPLVLTVNVETWLLAMFVPALTALVWTVRVITRLQGNVRYLLREVEINRKRYHANRTNVGVLWSVARLSREDFDDGPDADEWEEDARRGEVMRGEVDDG